MIERIHIENYKCLRDVTVELGDFTVLIGPNDSGKSSFLEALQVFGKVIKNDFDTIFGGDRSLRNLVWHKDEGKRIVLEAAGNASGQHTFRYYLEFAVDGESDETLEWDGEKQFWTEDVPPAAHHGHASHPSTIHVTKHISGSTVRRSAGQLFLRSFANQGNSDSVAVRQALSSSVEYRFDPQVLSKPSVPQAGQALSPTGDNLAAVLDVMQNSAARASFQNLQEALQQAVPSISGIVLPPAQQQPGAKALQFILTGNSQSPVAIPASLASSGALLLTAFLTIAYTQTPEVLLFEEPENGLHPTRLQMVVDILRKMSRGELGGRKRQILLTTHNPLLLNYASADEVRVFVRDSVAGTRITPMKNASDIDRLLKEFSLGELWYLLGEEKLFQEQSA